MARQSLDACSPGIPDLDGFVAGASGEIFPAAGGGRGFEFQA